MKRLIALFIAALVVPILASAQPVRITPARVGQLVAALPSTCAVGDVVFLTTAPIGLHECKTLNTWTATGSGGGGGAITCLDTGVLFADGADTPACDAGFTYNKTTDALTVGTVQATAFLSGTANPASAGVVRLANLDKITSRNFANDGDLVLLETNDDDTVIFGDYVLAATHGYLALYDDGSIEMYNLAATAGISLQANGTLSIYGVPAYLFGALVVDSTVQATYLITSGSGLTVANVGANSCGTDAATIAGGPASFEITVGATAGTQCRVTFPTAAPNRWNCSGNNDTTNANLVSTKFIDTTNVDFLGTFVAGDVVSGVCIPR